MSSYKVEHARRWHSGVPSCLPKKGEYATDRSAPWGEWATRSVCRCVTGQWLLSLTQYVYHLAAGSPYFS